MFSKTVIQTSIVIIATSALLIGGLGVIAAKAAPLNHSQIQTSETTAKENQVRTPSFGKHRSMDFRTRSDASVTRNGFHSRNNFTKRQIPGYVLTPKSR